MPTPPRTTATIWDERYRDEAFAFGTEPNEFLASKRELFRPGQRVLVPGDGEGRNGVWLATLGLDLVTVDASEVGCDKARRLASERGVTIDARCADLNQWDWPVGTFDAVVAIYIHFPPAERLGLHRRMYDALRPGGFVLLESYSPRHLSKRKDGSVGGPPPDMLVTIGDLAGDFQGAEMQLLEEREVMLNEGVRHTGRSEVVRMIARKP